MNLTYSKNKVSIIVVSFNHESFIVSCIKSILSQTYQDFEIILIENFSTDNTRILLTKFKDHPKIKTFLLNKNLGLCGGINEGLKHISGEFVTFFASDDIMISNRLEQQVNFLNSCNQNVAGCFGNMLRIKDDNSIHSAGLLPIVGLQKWSLEDILFKRINLYSPSQLYRTSIIQEKIKKFPSDVKIEDIWLYHKLLDAGYELYTLPYLLTMYRIHKKNTHTQYKMMMLEKLRILDEYSDRPYYHKAKKFIYLEHFSNFGSTSKLEAIKLLPKVFSAIDSKYLYIGILRLLFDWRSIG